MDSQKEIAVIVKAYPRLTETFIAQELEHISSQGFKVRIFSLHRPDEATPQNTYKINLANTHYLPPFRGENGIRSIAIELFKKENEKMKRRYLEVFRIIHSDKTREPLRRFHQSCWIYSFYKTHKIPLPNLIYAHFIHAPAEVAYFLSKLLDVEYAVFAHAKDIYTQPKKALSRRINSSKFVATCTMFNQKYLQSITSVRKEKIHLFYHGTNLVKFPYNFKTDKTSENIPPLVCVGRLVDIKGYPFILKSLKILHNKSHHLNLHIFGDGVKKDLYQSLAKNMKLTDHIFWHGSVKQEKIVEFYKQKRPIFVNGSVETNDGNKDGIPNTLVEAMAMGLPVVATRISGIPELVENEVSGLLVDPESPEQLASAIEKLIQSKRIRSQLGQRAHKKVVADFSTYKTLPRYFKFLTQHISN